MKTRQAGIPTKTGHAFTPIYSHNSHQIQKLPAQRSTIDSGFHLPARHSLTKVYHTHSMDSREVSKQTIINSERCCGHQRYVLEGRKKSTIETRALACTRYRFQEKHHLDIGVSASFCGDVCLTFCLCVFLFWFVKTGLTFVWLRKRGKRQEKKRHFAILVLHKGRKIMTDERIS